MWRATETGPAVADEVEDDLRDRPPAETTVHLHPADATVAHERPAPPNAMTAPATKLRSMRLHATLRRYPR